MSTSWSTWLDRAVARWPHAPAYMEASGAISYADLWERCGAVVRSLHCLGVVPGARVATLFPPSRLFVELLHAAQRARLTLVPLNPRLQGEELARLLAHAAPQVILTQPERLGELSRVIESRRLSTQVVDARALSGSETVRSRSIVTPMGMPEAEDILTLVYTSGTTAQPKGVLLRNANYEAGALASCERLGCRPGDRWLAAMPMCHVGGLSILVRASLLGLTVVQHAHFDAGEVERALREDDIAFVSLVPTMLSMLLEQAASAPFPSTLRAVVLGGGRLPPDLVRRSAERNLPLVATFGMTETAAQVTTSHPGDAIEYPGSAGHPLPGVELRIDQPDGDGCGEILVRGAQVFHAYHQAPELTARTLSDSWLHSGDLGRLDADGRLWVDVRRTDLIVSGGENIHPEEVEDVLRRHPSVADAGVFGVIDEHWGQRVVATVVLGASHDVSERSLRDWCRQWLTTYKVPREIRFASVLPRTESGKLQRQRLREAGGCSEPSGLATGAESGRFGSLPDSFAGARGKLRRP